MAMKKILHPCKILQNGQPALGSAAKQCSRAVTEDILEAGRCVSPLIHEDPLIHKDQRLRSMDELDGPPGWPLVGNFLTYLRKKNRGRMHEVQAEQHQQYGPMFREKWGPKWQVHISDPELIAQVYRQDGKYPNRPPIRSWRLYKQINDLPLGLMTGEGETWHNTRTQVQKKLMCPKSTVDMFEPLNAVSTDLIQKVRHLRKTKGEDHLKHQLQNELYKWGMEGAGSLLFETRFGCLDLNLSQRSQDFIDAVLLMLESSLHVIIGETLHQKLNTKYWQRHAEAWDKIYEIGAIYVNEKLAAIEKSLSEGENSFDGQKTGLLTYLLANKKMSLREIYSIVVELLVASVDTTANSVGFILYLTATHPHVQEKLYQEISEVLQGRTDLTSADVERMPYLRAVTKESQRLLPVATMNCRILDEDIILRGYVVPKNTLIVLNHYAAGRDPDIFTQPDEFIPERWLREDRNPAFKNHPFASLPFGFGSRSCVGQRIAKIEMHIILSKIIQNFHLSVDKTKPFKPTLRTLLVPGECLPIEFTDR